MDLADQGSNSHLLHWQADSLLLGHLGSHRKRCVHVHLQSCSTLCEPPDWSPPGFMSFSRPEYWSGLPFPSPGKLLNPGIKPVIPVTSKHCQADSLPLSHQEAHLRAHVCVLCAKLLQWCLTLCNPKDCSPPDSSVHRISQTRILEWVAISFSRGSS